MVTPCACSHISFPSKQFSPSQISLLHFYQAKFCAKRPFFPHALLLLLGHLFPSRLHWWCSGQPFSGRKGDSCGRTGRSGITKKLCVVHFPRNLISFSLALLKRHVSVRTALVICHFINRLWLSKIKMVVNEA